MCTYVTLGGALGPVGGGPSHCPWGDAGPLVPWGALPRRPLLTRHHPLLLLLLHPLFGCLQKWVDMLNTANISKDAEVVVAPPALYVGSVAGGLRKDIGVAAQVRFVGEGGQASGRTRTANAQTQALLHTPCHMLFLRAFVGCLCESFLAVLSAALGGPGGPWGAWGGVP